MVSLWKPKQVLLGTRSRGLSGECGDVTRSLGLDSRFLEETQITKPINEAVLPFADGNAIAIRQACRHSAAVRHRFARMTAIAIDVHLDIWNGGVEHRGKIFVGPKGMK